MFGLQVAILPVALLLTFVQPVSSSASIGSPSADLAVVIGILAFPFVGALIASRRPENRIGWLFLGTGLLFELSDLAANYAAYGLAHRTPGAALAALWGDATWLPGTALTGTFLFLLFPDGRLPSRRWRPLAVALVAAVTVAFVGTFVFEPTLYAYPNVPNPIAVLPSEPAFSLLTGLSLMLVVLSSVAALVSLVLRYRKAEADQRHQIKWFVFTAVVGIPLIVWGNVVDVSSGPLIAVGALAVIALPASVGIAILKYRLYDIDVVINKTLVYGLLAGFITAVYVGIVVGIGAAVGQGSKPNLGLSILATAVVAVAFQPVRDRVQKLANRLVYGTRATPYEVLSEFSSRMAQSYVSEDLLPRMARILAEGTGSRTAVVWLRVGSELRPEAAWPMDDLPRSSLPMPKEGIPPLDATLHLPVEHQGELLGALTLTKPAGERLTPSEEHLARDLASGAGLVLRNVRLTEELLARLEELRASRQRIVAAQDSERRRLERNIHDGAQQQLVALAVKVRLARSLAAKDPARASHILDQVESEVTHALEDLRDLARGIYPPLLADQGLVAALQAQARRASLPVTVQANGLGRYLQEAEAAVYFCVLEALQNVAKYAGASTATVRLTETPDDLNFEVSDDGVGFDSSKLSYGTGLQGMADRLSALGGELEVRSSPGAGTTVAGRLPIRDQSVGPEERTSPSLSGLAL
jgi:signal transduction histidine kinase